VYNPKILNIEQLYDDRVV